MKTIKYLVYIFSTISFILLFFSPFGPIKLGGPIGSFWHPIGWAGSLVYFATVLAFSNAYFKTKDKFWLVLIVGFTPLFISAWYFFPMPLKIFGWGMLMWAGVHLSILSLGLAIYSKIRPIRYSNLIMFLISPWIIPAALSGEPLGAIGLIWPFILTYSLAYYVLKQKNYLFVLGTILKFIANLIVAYTLITGTVTHLSGIITDRIAVFGRILMTLSVVILNTHQLEKDISKREETKKPVVKRKYKIISVIVLLLALTSISIIFYVKQPSPKPTDKYEQLLCTGATYNPNLTEIRGAFWAHPPGISNETLANNDFRIAKDLGLNTLRVIVFYDDPSFYDPPLEPGDERILNHVDMLVRTAKKHDLKLIVTLLDDAMVKIPMLNYDIDDLKTFVKEIVSRYVGNETIYAWDVVNEPKLGNPDHLNKTITLLRYVKSLDPTHPVTAGWVTGGEAVKEVDIITPHIYPQWSGLTEFKDPYPALEWALSDLKKYNKPIILEEFGINAHDPMGVGMFHDRLYVTERAQECYYFEALDIVKKSGIKGYIFQQLKDVEFGTRMHLKAMSHYGVVREDNTFKPAANALP
jgi:hypothetical protein